MSQNVSDLQPKSLWKYFDEICKVPHPSKKEGKLLDYLKQTVEKLGYKPEQDPVGNIVVRKPGSPGHEKAPRVLLQGHVDMVCEKNKGTEHDFDNDPIPAYVDGEWVKAKGTTLGADNGIGVAAALALLEAKDVVHPPLELLFTIDEETGLTGAKGLKPGFLQSETMLNLDSEEDGIVYVGCAGGGDTVGRLKIEWVDAPSGYETLELNVAGLKGGHSGTDIDKGRGNAIKILGRVLRRMLAIGDVQVVSLKGGSKRNAIAREADALVLAPAADIDKLLPLAAELTSTVRGELGEVEPSVEISLRKAPTAGGKVIARPQIERVLDAVLALPHGVLRMSSDLAGLVETSTNLATLFIEGEEIAIGTSQRSLIGSSKAEATEQVKAVMRLAGLAPAVGEGYPGWKPNMNSPLLAQFAKAYRELYGEEPQAMAIHAGLECGLIGEVFPKMDMISVGPTILDAHSPDERLHIPATEKFWKVLVKLLAQLAERPAA
ncbi:MAG TPA: cytosol nonspecific dipeptidase [Myxococcales bacterium]|nr:cytosol nonspecific dipeptidase [Myxococcales bacterium]